MTNHTLRIIRKWHTGHSTISEYRVDGSDIHGYILERPGPDTATPNQRLRIPEGGYQLSWHHSSLPGVAPHNPVPLLSNAIVPASRCILIHNGNHPRNTDGCLLVGKSRGTDFVSNSVTALRELKAFLDNAGIDSVSVIISSSYA